MSAIFQLPPLVLHPFSGEGSTEELLSGSQASLALEGLGEYDRGELDRGELERRVVSGRYQEIRMLVFLGKDLSRWLHQSVDCLQRSLRSDPRVNEQSFAALLVDTPPAAVREKLEQWGVTDRRAVFSRAIGMNSLFGEPPPSECLAPDFLKNYHRFADHAYICFQHLRPFFELDAKSFDFRIYASDEYARILSDEWEREDRSEPRK